MEKFYLMWYDAYLLYNNWETIDNIKKVFPISQYSEDSDGWVDCEHCYEFEAYSIEEVKKIVTEYLDNIGRIVDVFTVLNEKNESVLTEESI